MDEVFKRIADIRKSKGLTQRQICEKIGIAQNNYSKIETGITELTVDHLNKIAGALGVSVVSLIDPDSQSMDYFQELNSKIEALQKTILEKDEFIALQKKLYGNFKSTIIQSISIAELKSMQFMAYKIAEKEIDTVDLIIESIKSALTFILMMLRDNDFIDEKDLDYHKKNRKENFELLVKELKEEAKQATTPQKSE
ncbi:MAG: helix-turn-helix transcriptional regulator [Bacteroidia bacterium]|nr:helix-turn-helix transcriptional regulator [Bacteroidia bacterium]